jgi:hypothetical protein
METAASHDGHVVSLLAAIAANTDWSCEPLSFEHSRAKKETCLVFGSVPLAES